MSNTNANAAPAANVKPDTAAGPVKFDIKAPEIANPVASLMDTARKEAGAYTDAENAKGTASGAAWATYRDTTLAAIAAVGPVNARLILDAFRAEAKLDGKLPRVNQYVSDLMRAVKAADMKKELPAELATATRNLWTDNAFWAASGVLKATGTKKGSGKAKKVAANTTTAPAAKPEGEEGEGEEAGDGSAIATAATAVTQDADIAELVSILTGLRGVFRKEAIGRCLEQARQVAKKAAKASGTGQTG